MRFYLLCVIRHNHNRQPGTAATATANCPPPADPTPAISQCQLFNLTLKLHVTPSSTSTQAKAQASQSQVAGRRRLPNRATLTHMQRAQKTKATTRIQAYTGITHHMAHYTPYAISGARRTRNPSYGVVAIERTVRTL